MSKTIMRVVKDSENPYVMMNKLFLKDKNLSLKAKGLLAYLLSLPDDWQIYESELIEHHQDGRDSIRSAIKELVESGHIVRDRERNDKGQLKAYTYCVYEVSTKNGFSNVGKPNVGKPDTTNNNNTNNKITKEDSTISSCLEEDREYFIKGEDTKIEIVEGDELDIWSLDVRDRMLLKYFRSLYENIVKEPYRTIHKINIPNGFSALDDYEQKELIDNFFNAGLPKEKLTLEYFLKSYPKWR